MNSSNIEKASNTMEPMGKGPFNDRKGNKESFTSSDFTITGYSSYNAMNEFIDGLYVITEGEITWQKSQ